MNPHLPERRRIRSLRPARPRIDPWRPIDVLCEEERLPGGGRARVVTIFLAGSECPFTCVFCDLWRFTTDRPTPPGAIPAQIEQALASVKSELEPELGAHGAHGAHVKLYNASNFFDPKAVPPGDDAEIARRVGRFRRVIVECHPRLVGERCLAFAERLEGQLQVAMGLETVHAQALPRLGKQATLDDFRRAADLLDEHGIGWRAFVLLGAPFVPDEDAVTSAERSARFAIDHGAEHVTLIPVRGGNGEMERLARAGHFVRPRLAQVEAVLDRCLGRGGVVTVDTWDLEALAECPSCRAERIARLERINLSGSAEPTISCGACNGGTM